MSVHDDAGATALRLPFVCTDSVLCLRSILYKCSIFLLLSFLISINSTILSTHVWSRCSIDTLSSSYGGGSSSGRRTSYTYHSPRD